jgi:hypothetical protein
VGIWGYLGVSAVVYFLAVMWARLSFRRSGLPMPWFVRWGWVFGALGLLCLTVIAIVESVTGPE